MDATPLINPLDKGSDPLTVPAWYAVHTRSRHEQVVYDQLAAKGAEVFLPKMEIWSRRTDRRKRISVPMFPGYLFVKTTLMPDRHLSVLKTVGVVKMVGFSSRPAEVNPVEISSLKVIIEAGEAIHPEENFRQGDMVRITDGPFKGVVGRLIGRRSTQKLVVAVEIINRAVSVEIPDHMLIRAEPF